MTISRSNLRQWMTTLIVALALHQSAIAQEPPAESRPITLEHQIVRCFERGEYPRAIELIDEFLEHAPNDAGMLYNLACAHSRLEEFDAAASALLRSFKAGFNDIEHLRRDPDLAGLREHPTYKTILEQADKVSAKNVRSAVEHWRETYGAAEYRYETDDEHRLHYATALDESSHTEMRAMLRRQADQMIESLFGEPPSYSVLVAVPTPEHADKYFNGNDSIGGIYEHGRRRLVARDIGSSLRHEFCHLMHFGHMERLRQQHPLWIQEGLASLYEDYEFLPDGSIKFLPNDRQVVVKGRSKAGRLVKWKDLFAMTAGEFMQHPQRMYPQVRSIFEFIAAQNKLEAWYSAYVEHFEEDATSLKAFEIAFVQPIDQIEREWRKWVAAQPAIDLFVSAGDAALGIRSGENLSNDGVLVTHVVPGSAAQRARIRVNDTIVAIDERSTRSLGELRNIIAQHKVGDEIEVRVRRKGEYLTIKVVLRPLEAGV